MKVKGQGNRRRYSNKKFPFAFCLVEILPNEKMNYSNNNNESVPLPFGEVEIIVGSSTIFSLCLFGIIANIVTIAGVLHSQALKSSLYFLLMSLCVSDLISALISPLALYRFTWGYKFWYWSDGLCKVFWGADISTSIVTAIHILMFSVLRFVSVQWPQKFRLFTLLRTKIFITIVWIGSSLIVFVPMILFFGAIKRDRRDPSLFSQWPSCGLLPNRIASARVFAVLIHGTFVYIPMVLTTICSIATSVQILVARKKRRKLIGSKSFRERTGHKQILKENKILLQLGLVVGSFLAGYIPRSAYHLYNLNGNIIVGSGNYNWWFAFLEYLFLRITESLNPIFYNLSSKKMRRATQAIIKVAWNKISRKEELISESANSKSTAAVTKFA